MSDEQTLATLRPAAKGQPFLRRVGVRNYKSIANCVIDLSPLTFLVGRNGSGKSNFLDALRLVADGLRTSLDHALKARGGAEAVRRRSTGHPHNFAIHLEINLNDREVAEYGFEIGSRSKDGQKERGGFFVKEERLRVLNARGQVVTHYRVHEAKVEGSSEEKMPPAAADRLYLVNAAGLPAFRGVYDALLAMGFYNVNPEAMKNVQNPDANELLRHDGSNIASVIARLSASQPDIMDRIRTYLATIVPGITDVARVGFGPHETLEFRQDVVGSKHPWRFHAASMSDGTLRALGTLVAVTQLAGRTEPVRLVGIEEPETALHPAAAGALMDALREASSHTQVLVTTHSPDLVDQIDPEVDKLLAVQATQGRTEIGPMDSASRKAIREHLYTAGELLRMDQLTVDREDLQRQQQMTLFADDEGQP